MATNTERIFIRVCPEDKELIKEYAKLANMNISEFIKYCIVLYIEDLYDYKRCKRRT